MRQLLRHTLNTQDGRVLEQNQSSVRQYGSILGSGIWRLADIAPQVS